MIFPKGDVVYERLNTSFTQIDAMLEELKGELFTGYVQLIAPNYVGTLLLSDGYVANAVEEVGGQRRNGGEAADRIIAKGRERAGLLSVFRLSAEMAQLLIHFLQSEVLYKDLTSDLTSLDRLIAGLQGRRHSGYIEVQLLKSRHAAMVFLWEGKVLESTLDRQGKFSAGPRVQEEIILLAAAEGAVFTVYSTRPPKPADEPKPAEGHGPQEQLGVWQEVLKAMEGAVDPPTRAGVFLAAFKRAGIELATSFPFLDPFADEFEYRDGRIRFEGQESAAIFNQGLSRCLAQCLRTLATQPGTRDFQGRLSSAASGLKKRHGGRLTEIGLTAALPEVFGS
jgi:hypothetical protein